MSPATSTDPATSLSDADMDEEPSDFNESRVWTSEAGFVPPQPGCRSISLTLQPHPLRTVIRATINQIIGDMLFVDAYPSPATINTNYVNLLIQFTEQYEFFELRDRLMTDKAMVEHVRRLLSTRLSNARCLVKKTALPKIESAYNFGHTGPERQERAKALIKSGDYIFPCTQ
ncbi:hypothetical protein H0H81_006790, partial [Sphagnurus paluster]